VSCLFGDGGEIMIRIYDFFYPPDQEGLFLSILKGAGLRAIVPMERKGLCYDFGTRHMRITGHLEGPDDAFQGMESSLAQQGYRFCTNHVD
jgi:hypothetical protein